MDAENQDAWNDTGLSLQKEYKIFFWEIKDYMAEQYETNVF